MKASCRNCYVCNAYNCNILIVKHWTCLHFSVLNQYEYNYASRFTRFVCPALRFIPNVPRKKDTHSLNKIYMNIQVVTLSFLLGLIATKLQKVLLWHVYFNNIQQRAYMYIVTNSFFGGGGESSSCKFPFTFNGLLWNNVNLRLNGTVSTFCDFAKCPSLSSPHHRVSQICKACRKVRT